MNRLQFIMEQSQSTCLRSEELNSIFDESKYSEHVRKFRYKISPIDEVLKRTQFPIEIAYTKGVGSETEGTELICSDKDTLYISKHDVSVDNNPNEPNIDSSTPYVCLTRGPLTPPGYTKLQIYLNEKSCKSEYIIKLESKKTFFDIEIYIDNKHNMFLSHNMTFFETYLDQSTLHSWDRHGPAETIKFYENGRSIDCVVAFESKKIPHDMDPWFDRPRPNNWPSEATRNLFRTMGCYYVGVGHSNSPEQDLEWRISPTLQELYLMLNLNPTQFRCYILLKVIKKFIITYICGDSISSYHCKTMLFYTIENSSAEMWQPRNLISCVIECLKRLVKWVAEKKCPNYFIPKENMFETKLDKAYQIESLKAVLTCMIDMKLSNVHYGLTTIVAKEGKANDSLIDVAFLFNVMLINFQNHRYSLSEQRSKIEQYTKLIKTNHLVAQDLFQKMVCPFEIDIYIILELFEYITLYLNRMDYLKSLMDKKVYPEKDLQAYMLDVSEKIPGDLEFCLKLATFAAAHSDFTTCDRLLQHAYSIGIRVNVKCICSSCSFKRTCSIGEMHRVFSDLFTKKCIRVIRSFVERKNQRFVQDVLQHFLSTACLHFDYIENSVAMPVHFEAQTIKGGHLDACGARKEIDDLYFNVDFISIHPTAYLYFLQYKSSECMYKKSDTCVALEKLEHIHWLVLQEETYFHQDTILNILGHIYITKGWYKLAIQCFSRSWQLIANSNAAKFHVMFMLFDSNSK